MLVNDFLLEMSGICTVLLSYFEQIIVLVSQFKIFLFETMVVLCKTCHITLFHLSPFTSILCKFIMQLLLPYILSSKNSAFIFLLAVITAMLFKLVESGIWVNCQFAS